MTDSPMLTACRLWARTSDKTGRRYIKKEILLDNAGGRSEGECFCGPAGGDPPHPS